MSEYKFSPLKFSRLPEAEMLRLAGSLHRLMSGRRSVRSFSSDPVPRDCIESAIRTASMAPSGANRQPWRFVAISEPELKKQIRVAAEKEEKRSYQRRMPEEWLEAVEPLGTDWRKPFLEVAPWLVVVFAQSYGLNSDGSRRRNYYVSESVGIACGFFIAAIHHMGLVTLTHTPSPMAFLTRILRRPANERPYMLFPVGYPAEDATVPDLLKKRLEEVAVWI